MQGPCIMSKPISEIGLIPTELVFCSCQAKLLCPARRHPAPQMGCALS